MHEYQMVAQIIEYYLDKHTDPTGLSIDKSMDTIQVVSEVNPRFHAKKKVAAHQIQGHWNDYSHRSAFHRRIIWT